jgi:CheY-like chemotaxis protein
VLADDDVLLREGLASLLGRSGFEVVGQAGTSTELLDLVRSLHPELAIIDIRMPPTQDTEGLRAAWVIRDELSGTAIVILSAHVEVDEAMELLAGGDRVGYLLKARVTDLADFIETVERITAGVGPRRLGHRRDLDFRFIGQIGQFPNVSTPVLWAAFTGPALDMAAQPRFPGGGGGTARVARTGELLTLLAAGRRASVTL